MSSEFQLVVVLLVFSWAVLLAVIAFLARLLRLAHIKLTEMAGVLVPRRPGGPFFSPGDKPTGRYGEGVKVEELLDKMRQEEDERRKKAKTDDLAKEPLQKMVHGLGGGDLGDHGDAGTI